MKRCRNLYEEEKQRYEEVLQSYQEDHMDEMEIINLHKMCNNKDRKLPQPKNAPKPLEPIDSSEEEQRPRNASRPEDGRKTATKAGKKLKRPHSRKKHQSHLNLLNQASFPEGERRGTRFF